MKNIRIIINQTNDEDEYKNITINVPTERTLLSTKNPI
jgi:hypothetical protein